MCKLLWARLKPPHRRRQSSERGVSIPFQCHFVWPPFGSGSESSRLSSSTGRTWAGGEHICAGAAEGTHKPEGRARVDNCAGRIAKRKRKQSPSERGEHEARRTQTQHNATHSTTRSELLSERGPRNENNTIRLFAVELAAEQHFLEVLEYHTICITLVSAFGQYHRKLLYYCCCYASSAEYYHRREGSQFSEAETGLQFSSSERALFLLPLQFCTNLSIYYPMASSFNDTQKSPITKSSAQQSMSLSENARPISESRDFSPFKPASQLHRIQLAHAHKLSSMVPISDDDNLLANNSSLLRQLPVS